LWFSGCGSALPISAPIVGTKISAYSIEADNVTISVIGMYFMNSPTMPGQNRRGEKAATRVMVAAITGPAMRCEAAAKASRRCTPIDIWRSAYSVTMIASSTSIPTARISENSTTMLTV
jgi:hypothetical protein